VARAGKTRKKFGSRGERPFNGSHGINRTREQPGVTGRAVDEIDGK
jgi:hypothetical protein